MWIVMTASAHMPTSCKGRYGKIALVRINAEYTTYRKRPKMISLHAKGVERIIQMGCHNMGKTDRCAFRKTLAEAERRAYELNNSTPEAEASLLMSFGSA